MKEEQITPTCKHGKDLIGFLYGELDETQMQDFGNHVQHCVNCKTELAGLREVRQSIGAWRQETLGVISADTVSRSAPAIFMNAAYRKPSALAAVRQFFSLSPLWMKGAVAFVSLLFCLLAILAIAHLTEGSRKPVVVTTGPSEQEIQRLIEKRADEKFQALQARQNKKSEDAVAVVDQAQVTRAAKPPHAGSPAAGSKLTSIRPKQRPLSRSERDQLAADLRLASQDDDDLDLLGDKIRPE